ncbi:MAG: alpha-glucan family phosphorylase, partial [Spirochaetaceae bacterium]|nr:alpha-glucan family phosphorylase [Spirochaetaceae bacterium]
VQNRIIFIENYDMTVAHYMTSGGDVWLNTPRRPMEASGTSGMKASMNGVLNCSVLDGWWDEAYNANVGWAIGQGEMYADEKLQDEIESKGLYDILEQDIIPLYYQRDRSGLPRGWIAKMKCCMREIGQSMSSHRMLTDYANQFYIPALKNAAKIVKTEYDEPKQLAAYFDKLAAVWDKIKIGAIEADSKPVMQRGDTVNVGVYIDMGSLSPDELTVQLYHGAISSQTKMIEDARCTEMTAEKQEGSGWKYHVKIQCNDTGLQGHTVRILPKHKALVHSFRPGYVKWA